jgi:hypothetical protein
MQVASATKEVARPRANRAAPIGGPASWFTVIKPAINRALPSARSERATITGSSVAAVVSARTSQVPRRNKATRTTTMLTRPVKMEALIRTAMAARER